MSPIPDPDAEEETGPSTGCGTSSPVHRGSWNRPTRRLNEAIACRDLHAVVALAWTQYWKELYWFFRRKGETDPTARELVVDSFALLLDWWPGFDGAQFCGWLYSIARYTWFSHRAALRRDKRRRVLLSLSNQQESAFHDHLDCREQMALVLGLVADMDAVDQMIFEESFWHGLGSRAIAGRLEETFHCSFTVEAIRTRRHRIRRRICDRLARANSDDGAACRPGEEQIRFNPPQ